MKKFMLTLALMLGFIVTAQAGGTYVHDASILPKAALATITNNFKSGVSVIKVDKEFGSIHEYEVILTDGTEITFDKSGNWDNIETSNASRVPASFIPREIREYVAKNHAGARIVGIDKERKGYEIDLSNGIEIKFDKAGKFQKYEK